MKRLLFVFVLTLCLSFPVFAGHTLPGDWCECGSFAGCFCDPGEQPVIRSKRTVDDSKPNVSKQGAPVSLGSETLLILAVLLLLLRYKA
jgi:hypothetical protein